MRAWLYLCNCFSFIYFSIFFFPFICISAFVVFWLLYYLADLLYDLLVGFPRLILSTIMAVLNGVLGFQPRKGFHRYFTWLPCAFTKERSPKVTIKKLCSGSLCYKSNSSYIDQYKMSFQGLVGLLVLMICLQSEGMFHRETKTVSNVENHFVFPGTKWCGKGNNAMAYNDLGEWNKIVSTFKICVYRINNYSLIF